VGQENYIKLETTINGCRRRHIDNETAVPVSDENTEWHEVTRCRTSEAQVSKCRCWLGWAISPRLCGVKAGANVKSAANTYTAYGKPKHLLVFENLLVEFQRRFADSVSLVI